MRRTFLFIKIQDGTFTNQIQYKLQTDIIISGWAWILPISNNDGLMDNLSNWDMSAEDT